MVRKSNKKASPASASRDRLAQSAGSGVVVCDTAMYDPPAEGGMKVLCFNEKVQLERHTTADPKYFKLQIRSRNHTDIDKEKQSFEYRLSQISAELLVPTDGSWKREEIRDELIKRVWQDYHIKLWEELLKAERTRNDSGK